MRTADWVATYLDGRLARAEIGRKSVTLLRSRLATLVAVCPRVSDLTRAGIDKWLASLTMADASRRAYLSTTKGFTAWMVDQGHLDTDPCARVPKVREPRRVPRAFHQAQVTALLEVLPDSRAWAIVMLMLGCGLRAAEVSNLEMADWDQDGATLFVRGKAGHERMVPVPDEATLYLDKYIADRGHHGGPLIEGKRWAQYGRGLSAAAISNYVSWWIADAGVKKGAYDGRSGHALRHTCASDVFAASKNLRAVQQMLGHQSLATTERYLRNTSMDEMREAMAGRTYSAPDPTPPAKGRKRGHLQVVA